MGLRGPAPKDPRRQGDPDAKMPDEIPDGLDDRAAELFVSIIEDLIDRRAYREHDVDVVARYVKSDQYARKAQGHLDRIMKHRAPDVKEVANWTRIVRGFQHDAHDYGTRLGVDPLSRNRLPSRRSEARELGDPNDDTTAGKMRSGIGTAPSQKLRIVGKSA